MAFMGAKTFGGIMPRIDASELPMEAAQVARDVDLTGRNLKAIDFSAPFYSLNDGEDMVNGIPAGEVVTITPGTVPNVASERILSAANVTTRLTINAYRWLSYLHPDTNEWVVAPNDAEGSIVSLVFTEYGMRIDYAVPAASFHQKAGIRYVMNGPLFQFQFAERSASNAGPDSAQSFPIADNLSPENAQFPQCMMPFSDSNAMIFGYFQVVRCDHPSAPEEFYDPNISEAAGVQRFLPANNSTTMASFYINMNYVDNTRRRFYYVQSEVDGSDREGPPSDISQEVIVQPGERVKITGSQNNRVYRSTGSREGFAALEGGAKLLVSPYYDDFSSPLGQELPMYGNPPTFEDGNLLHPAQFGVAFKNNEVWFSDVYRLHVWPEEWKVKFDSDVAAIQLVGASIVVFTEGPNEDDGRVYMMTGSDPRYMGKHEIISTAPMLNKLSLCKIGQSLFYVSHDGLMAVSREGAQNLTEAHFTREEWLELDPEYYSSEVANSSVFLQHEDDGVNLRIDLNEGIAKVSEWTVKTEIAGEWRSRRFAFSTPVRFTAIRVLSLTYPEDDDTINLVIHDEDNGHNYTVPIIGPKSLRPPRMIKSRNWSFTIDVPENGEIEHVAIAGSTAELEIINQAG